jgi:hypothetical protein
VEAAPSLDPAVSKLGIWTHIVNNVTQDALNWRWSEDLAIGGTIKGLSHDFTFQFSQLFVKGTVSRDGFGF